MVGHFNIIAFTAGKDIDLVPWTASKLAKSCIGIVRSKLRKIFLQHMKMYIEKHGKRANSTQLWFSVTKCPMLINFPRCICLGLVSNTDKSLIRINVSLIVQEEINETFTYSEVGIKANLWNRNITREEVRPEKRASVITSETCACSEKKHSTVANSDIQAHDCASLVFSADTPH